MDRSLKLLRAAAGAVVIACAMTVSSCSIFESKFNSACEDGIKKRLLAPSGYKRIALQRRDEVLTRDEFVAHMAATNTPEGAMKSDLESFDKGRLPVTKFTAVIEYDAPNAYGTPIRFTSICEYVSETGKDDQERDFYALFLTIDGETDNQWLIRRVTEAK